MSAWDDQSDRGINAAQAYGLEYKADAEEVFCDPRVDAVIITTETNRHVEFIERAAAAGKHILCQKPLATTLKDCDRIIRAVQQAGVKFSMAHQMRHDPVNQKIKELLEAKAIGKVASTPPPFHRCSARRRFCQWCIALAYESGRKRGHVLPDDASHATDWFYWMLGCPGA